MRSSTPWNFEIIFRHAVKTTIKRNVGKKCLRWITEEVALRYASFALRGWRSARYQSGCHRDKEQQQCLAIRRVLDNLACLQSLISRESKNTSERDFPSFLLFRLMVLSGSPRLMSLDTPRRSWLVLRRFKSRSIPSIMTTVIPQILSPFDWFSIDRDSPFRFVSISLDKDLQSSNSTLIY